LEGGRISVLQPFPWTGKINSFSHQQHCDESHKWKA
jgi:hypothetical protein